MCPLPHAPSVSRANRKLAEIGPSSCRGQGGPRTMSRKHSRKRTHPKPKAVLRLPDLDQAKSAVLNSLRTIDIGVLHEFSFHGWPCGEHGKAVDKVGDHSPEGGQCNAGVVHGHSC